MIKFLKPITVSEEQSGTPVYRFAKSDAVTSVSATTSNLKGMKFLKPTTSNLQPNSGITLIEIIIVVVLISLIASLGLSIGIDVYRSSSLASEKDLFISALERARNLAVTNVGGSAHGVYIEDGEHTIFRGTSFASRDMTYDLTIDNTPLITATGTIEFVFEQLSGDGLATGTLTITDDRGVSRAITVNEEGGLDW